MTTPLILLSITPTTATDQENLARGLQVLAAQDPALTVNIDPHTGETVIGGMSETHLEVIVHRLAREFLVTAAIGRPRIAYKETLTREADGEATYAKHSGGRGHYGQVKLHLRPQEPGSGCRFENAIAGGAIPERFIPSIHEGVTEALARGVLGGHPIVDVSVELYDGSYHDVDSSEDAFRIAAALAVQDAAKKAGPVVLEPILRVQAVVPARHARRVFEDLLARGAMRLDLREHDGTSTITGRAPLDAVFGYAPALSQLTVGHGACDVRFERFEQAAGGGSEDAGLQPMPVAPPHPLPTLGPLKAELKEPDSDGAP